MAPTESGTAADELSASLPPPTAPARPRLVTAMALAQFGVYFALLTPVMASLVIKVQTLVSEDRVITMLGMITSLGAAAALIANPVFGRISDRTNGRFGRRRPWLVLGAAVLAACLFVIGITDSVVVIAAAWFVGQVLGNAAFAAFMATVADQVPMFQRGKVSGLLGVMQNVAILGAAYAAQFLGSNLLLLFVVPGLTSLVLVVVLAAVLPDQPLPRRPHREWSWLQLLSTFWVNPRRYPDFAFTWASRFLVILASFMFTTYRLLYLQHELSLTATHATAIMATGVLIYTLVLAVSAQTAGWLSDRLHRRKIFVGLATLVFGLGMVLLVQASSITGFFVAEAVLGLGYGTYIGVDLALVVDVLPDPEDSAKDLGVFNIANTAPQALAPAVGATLLNVGVHNYDLLLSSAAVVCAIGALAIVPVRSVR